MCGRPRIDIVEVTEVIWLPRISPIRLARVPEPFDHPHWLFELKWDGFRASAYVDQPECRLVSRKGNRFRRFAPLSTALAEALVGHNAILDGEIVALDPSGRADFYSLLYRRADPYYYAFDLLWLDGRDLRGLALVERKAILHGLVPLQPSRLLYVDHVVASGVDLFRAVCEQDIERVVAKRKDGVYDPNTPTWVKIKNRQYSQAVNRHERFERMRA